MTPEEHRALGLLSQLGVEQPDQGQLATVVCALIDYKHGITGAFGFLERSLEASRQEANRLRDCLWALSRAPVNDAGALRLVAAEAARDSLPATSVSQMLAHHSARRPPPSNNH